MSDSIQARIRRGDMTSYQIIVITICLTINMLDGFDILAIAFAAPALAKEWNLSPAVLGMLFSSGLAGMMIGSLALSPVADHIGRRQSIIYCLVIISVGMLVSAITENAWQLAVMRFVTGLGIGGMLASLNTLVAEYSSDKRRDLAISILQIGVPLGGTIGGIFSVYMVEDFGWRSIFWFGGLMSSVMIFVALPFIPESLDYLTSRQPKNALDRINRVLPRLNMETLSTLPHQPERKSRSKVQYARLFEGDLALKTIAICVCFFMTMASFYFVISWTPKLLVDLGMDQQQGLSGGLILNIGGVIGSLLLGYIAPHIGIGRLTSFYMILSILFMAIFGFLKIDIAIMVAIAFLLGGFIYGAMIGLYAIVPNIFPVEVRTTGTGLAIGLARLGGIAGPYVAGLFIAAGWTHGSIFVTLAIPLVIAALVVLSFRLNRRVLA